MTKTALLILAFALVGCAPYVWTKPGATQADFNTDDYQCQVENRYLVQPEPTVSGGLAAATNKPHLKVDQAGHSACMRARGWAYERQ